MTVDPIGEVDIRPDPVLDEIRMRFEKLCVDHEQSDDKLPIGPQCALIEKESTINEETTQPNFYPGLMFFSKLLNQNWATEAVLDEENS